MISLTLTLNDPLNTARATLGAAGCAFCIGGVYLDRRLANGSSDKEKARKNFIVGSFYGAATLMSEFAYMISTDDGWKSTYTIASVLWGLCALSEFHDVWNALKPEQAKTDTGLEQDCQRPDGAKSQNPKTQKNTFE